MYLRLFQGDAGSSSEPSIRSFATTLSALMYVLNGVA